MTKHQTPQETLAMLLRTLKLPSFAGSYEDVAARAEREGWAFGQYLHHLCELEVAERAQRRIERLLRKSDLPGEKTLATLEPKKVPTKVWRQVPVLCDGGFLGRAQNILAFGLPGRGKTHLVCAIGHELVRKGHAVLFTPTYRLVQRLLVAKRELTLERELQRLDTFDAVILDDIGYVQQDRDEMEVLFTFLSQRYERRSVIITSNIVLAMGPHLQGPDDNGCRHRPPSAPLDHLGNDRRQHSRTGGQSQSITPHDNYRQKPNDNYPTLENSN